MLIFIYQQLIYVFIRTVPLRDQFAQINIEKYPSKFYKIIFQEQSNTVNRFFYVQ